MPLNPTEANDGELDIFSVNIRSGKLSEEETGFGVHDTRPFEPTPPLIAEQVGVGVLTGNPTGVCCYPSPFYDNCAEVNEADCTLLNGIFVHGASSCAGTPGPCDCVCMRQVSISVTFTVTDNTPPCAFNETRTETLVTNQCVNLCGHGWGPFEFHYPELTNGQIFINSFAVGVSGSPPTPPMCFFTDGICGVLFNVNGGSCGSGYTCFNFGDAYYTGDNPCFPHCEPPSNLTFSWFFDGRTAGVGLTIAATVNVTIGPCPP